MLGKYACCASQTRLFPRSSTALVCENIIAHIEHMDSAGSSMRSPIDFIECPASYDFVDSADTAIVLLNCCMFPSNGTRCVKCMNVRKDSRACPIVEAPDYLKLVIPEISHIHDAETLVHRACNDLPVMSVVPVMPVVTAMTAMRVVTTVTAITDVRDVPDVPGVPDVPDVPAVPRAPDVPAVAAMPFVSGVSDVAVVANVADVPDMPDMPDVPAMPVLCMPVITVIPGTTFFIIHRHVVFLVAMLLLLIVVLMVFMLEFSLVVLVEW